MLEKIKPIKQQRIMDLVEAAGMDVSDRKNFSGGDDKAASNPKYCYEWSFADPNKLIILNLWYADLEEQDGEVFFRFNTRRSAKNLRACLRSFKNELIQRVLTSGGQHEEEIPERHYARAV